jgi:hypothetical protein
VKNLGKFSDTGYRSVEKAMTPEDEAKMPTCPEFKNIGSAYGTHFF